MLTLDSVNKTYGSHRAVVDLSFEASPGKIYGLIGPNGAGKSTTIRMILGILSVDTGTIRLDKAELTDTDRVRIGYLPEERGLYKKQKLVDVLLYLAALKGCKKEVALKRLDYWLERFELTEWKNRKLDTLSKGMSQKIQFVASVLHDPDIVFLDEPFSGLDPVSADELLAVIREMREQGKLVLFSTHVMEQAEKVCDHIIMLDKGRKILDDSLPALRRSFGTGTVNLSLSGDLPDARCLRDLKGVREVKGSLRDFELGMEKSADLAVLFSAIAGLGLAVRTFAVNEPSLHEIFVQQVELKGAKP